ncbi:MAG: ABC transporter ATP-binding protein [Deltaproteobacteria bacterium]|nr:ABC transporter ATP-binding protein [Deltaproteobacteria bacterium]MBW1921921.1 ABC transporter ATP-binding protein [Deltaproteobacteria bacterium]MBW1948811.1 ABC transporter ATP-binding protein [Deltaproteobacteria bacterium]MBW2006488.1 ABC transporter ATP-binding protein [Deltaproteobacteria bacterium]MBW2101184.1 ABC transporter ATP-binding protein [Deltaproteobacteria bacterium]
MTKLLQVDGLYKSFGGVEAVKGVSFDLEEGELLAMIGPNGAGKSTCFNVINGQLTPDRGSVKILGQDTTGMKPHNICALGVGRTFQVTATFPSMTVLENVQMVFLSARGRLSTVHRTVSRLFVEQAMDLLRVVGVESQWARPCGILAYGDLKRVELAMALANRPRLLLMDEPTAGMGIKERLTLMKLIGKIASERAIGVLFTEHDMDVVFAHADRIIVLNHGVLIAQGSPAEVRDNHEVRRIYLGSYAR